MKKLIFILMFAFFCFSAYMSAEEYMPSKKEMMQDKIRLFYSNSEIQAVEVFLEDKNCYFSKSSIQTIYVWEKSIRFDLSDNSYFQFDYDDFDILIRNDKYEKVLRILKKSLIKK